MVFKETVRAIREDEFWGHNLETFGLILCRSANTAVVMDLICKNKKRNMCFWYYKAFGEKSNHWHIFAFYYLQVCSDLVNLVIQSVTVRRNNYNIYQTILSVKVSIKMISWIMVTLFLSVYGNIKITIHSLKWLKWKKKKINTVILWNKIQNAVVIQRL